jgi:hypothetical protein
VKRDAVACRHCLFDWGTRALFERILPAEAGSCAIVSDAGDTQQCRGIEEFEKAAGEIAGLPYQDGCLQRMEGLKCAHSSQNTYFMANWTTLPPSPVGDAEPVVD